MEDVATDVSVSGWTVSRAQELPEGGHRCLILNDNGLLYLYGPLELSKCFHL